MSNKKKKLVLLGRHLGHTFSPRYFADKFTREGVTDYEYGTLELADIQDFPDAVAANPELVGMNVTIPYKSQVIPYLDGLDETAEAIGAVNTIRFNEGRRTGFNTDVTGFRRTLEAFIPGEFNGKALILGTGGSSKAVRYVLTKMKIPFMLVSRRPVAGGCTYDELDGNTLLDYPLIINTTPLGMYPDTDLFPLIPYEVIDSGFYLFDLVYNPEETQFLKKGKDQGANVTNGYKMLEEQAEASWEIWTR